MKSVTLTLDGMSCEHCVKHVTEALGGLPGVERLDVGINIATLDLPDETTREQLDAVIDEAGYKVVDVQAA